MVRVASKDPYARALRWLAYHDYSKARITDRLRRSGFDTLVTENTVERLVQEGWVDDVRLAHHIVEHCVESKTMGPVLIRHHLISRGLTPEVYEPVLEQWLADIDWLKIAEALEERYDMNEPKERRRFGRYLIRRGFPAALASKLVAWAEEGTEGEL